jgi:hypothetical protein
MEIGPKEILLDFFKIIKASVRFKSDHEILVKLPRQITKKLDEPEDIIFKIDKLSPEDRFFMKIKKYFDNEEKGISNCAQLNIKIEPKNDLFKPNVINSKVKMLKISDEFFLVVIFNFKVLFLSSFEKHEDMFSVAFNATNFERIDLDTLQKHRVKIKDSKIKVDISSLDELYRLGFENIKLSSKNFIEKQRKDLLDNYKIKVEEIEKCYSQMIEEGDEERASILSKIKRDESKYRKLVVKKDLEKIEKRLKNYTDSLEELDSNTYIERLNEEKAGKIEEQKHLHKANVIFTLINAQLLQVSTKIAHFRLSRGDIKKNIEVHYDPIENKVIFPFCDVCKKEIKKGFLDDHSKYICDCCVQK